MRFTLISDVHVDNNPWDWNLLQSCDPKIPMVVSGDISNDVWETSHWIRDLRSRFDQVIWVMGNHDAYNLGFHKSRPHDPQFSATWPYPRNVAEIYDHYARWSIAHDVHFLNRSSCVISGVQFVGATGWHNFDAAPDLTFDDQTQAWQDHMNDSRHIRWEHDSKPAWTKVLQAALDDAEYIRNAVSANDTPKVVLTHHIPHRKFVKTTHMSMWNLLNGSFLNTELETCAHDSIKVWCFGHTHYRFDSDVNRIRYVNNARGYRHENPNWFPVEIEV